MTHRLYCGLYSKDPESAEVFREYICVTVAGDDSPTWDRSIANNVENMIIIPKETEETTDEE